jgi:hypothetical protein
MHAIIAFVDENCNGRIGAGVRDLLRHFFHDERIPKDETNDSGHLPLRPFAKDHSMIELNELHQTSLAQDGPYHVI